RGAGRQPVPLHRVSEHRRRRAAGRRIGGLTMTVTEEAGPEIGRARPRKEDARLITGRSRYTDNMTLPGMLHLSMVRSPVARARITSIDVSEARSATGVVAVLNGAGLADTQDRMPHD